MIEDYYNDKLVGNFAQELYVTYSTYNYIGSSSFSIRLLTLDKDMMGKIIQNARPADCSG